MNLIGSKKFVWTKRQEIQKKKGIEFSYTHLEDREYTMEIQNINGFASPFCCMTSGYKTNWTDGVVVFIFFFKRLESNTWVMISNYLRENMKTREDKRQDRGWAKEEEKKLITTTSSGTVLYSFILN